MQSDSYFSFVNYVADIPGGSVEFNYELTHSGKTRTFTEILKFESVPGVRADSLAGPVLTAILDSLHILLGISYWKTVCPRDIRVPGQELSESQAAFWNTVYTKGLGEFFYKNAIDFRNLIRFPYTEKHPVMPARIMQSDRSLVLLGSGKDSIVTAELLKSSNKSFSLFTVNPRQIHTKTAALIGKNLLTVQRILDPQLFELNNIPGTLNGHIPITAITSFIGIFAAYLQGFRYVVLSNEESANYGNVEYLGSQINHQWSKTLEFEKLLRGYIRTNITEDIEYFSLLRPLTEMNITKLFVRFSGYFQVFSSCNRNFGILKDTPESRWCGECPKCAFVFLLLAAFLPKAEVMSIFSQNLLNKQSLLSTYKELLGIEGVKPFECVGTPEEVLAAFASVLEHGEYANDVIVKSLSFAVNDRRKDKNVILNNVLTPSAEHCIPAAFSDVVTQL